MERFDPRHPRVDALRPSFIGAIAQLHASHELRSDRAHRVRNADVAGLDRDAARVVAELIGRVGGRAVHPDVASLLVASAGAEYGARSRAPVVDVDEFRQMVAAFEETFRPKAAELQMQRALQRAASEVMAARRTSASGGRRTGGSRMRSRPEAGLRVPSSLSPAEQDLQERARERAA